MASSAGLPAIGACCAEAIGLLELLGLRVCVNAYRCSDDYQRTQSSNEAASGSQESVGAGHGLELVVGSAPDLFNVAQAIPAVLPHLGDLLLRPF